MCHVSGLISACVSAVTICIHIFNHFKKPPCISHIMEVLPKPNLQPSLIQVFRTAFPEEEPDSEKTSSFPLKTLISAGHKHNWMLSHRLPAGTL